MAMEMETERRFRQPSVDELEGFMAQQFPEEPPAEPQAPKRNAEAIMARLAEPFRRDQISQRKIGGRMLDYVEGHEYITRLNEASPAWSFRMTGHEFRDLNVKRWNDATRQSEPVVLPCLTVYGELEIPGVGTRAGIGVQMIEDNAGEDVMKGALTDCLKNCAKYFGLGLHMYSGDAPAPVQQQGQPAQVPAPQNAENAQHRANTHATGDFDKPLPPSGGRPASERQVNAVFAIAKRAGANPEEWAIEAGADGTDGLSSQQASWLIEKYGGPR